MQQILSKSIQENYLSLKAAFRDCSDFVIRIIPSNKKAHMFIAYIEGMIDRRELEQNILVPLLYIGVPQGMGRVRSLSQMCESGMLSILNTRSVNTISDVIQGILKANAVIVVNGDNSALVISVSDFDKRNVQEPTNETVLRGSREGFTESIQVNSVLLRRRISSPQLKMESLRLGEVTRTDVIIAYIDGIVDCQVLTEIKRRINEIKLPGIVDSGFIEECIQDSPLSPFPQIMNTERPDVVTANLLEGRIAILVDGSPTALVAPVTFWSGLQAPDDYYERFLYASMRRFVRYTFALLSLIIPALYVALTTYNPELVPNSLMMSISMARENTPFPTVIEVMLMEFIFEGLQEAGIRLPTQLGPIVSIVGALVVGEAAVRAGIVSAPVVIVVSLTGIASYAIPRYSFSLPFRILRFFLLLMSGLFGVYGISLGLIAIMVEIVTLESIGKPYFAPISPSSPKGFKDVFIRRPRWNQRSSKGSR